MRFRVIGDGRRKGLAGSRDGISWQALFEGDAGFPGLLDTVIRCGNGALAAAFDALGKAPACDIAAYECLPPFMQAGKILCVGLNYMGHVKESGAEVPAYPTVFARFNTGLVGHGQPLVRPKASFMFDYESELAAIIGKPGRHISEADALDHVAGYSIFNDGSVRDFQLRTPQWTIGKNFDGTGAFGPDFVTSDELPAGCEGLRMRGLINGEIVQDAPISDLIFNVRRLVALISAAMTLEAGDVIVTGTPSGVGLSFKPARMLRAGDVFEIEIDRIGTLRNPVIDER